MTATTDTICAVATPAGRGGVSIVRLSGPKVPEIAARVLGFQPRPRYAHYGPFLSAGGETLDVGIGLFFPAPHSLTGEDVLELQSHGGPVLVDGLMTEVRALGARLARPGEFSERAFINEKMDLAQAEAVADLIESSSMEAARSALRSLQGEFSRLIQQLVQSITELRIYVEAAIDFPEEEVDFLDSGKVMERLDKTREKLNEVFRQARQGAILREGLRVVIAGEPNAGKSSLLNRLSGQDSAIVTDIPGTTRDTLREHISIDGMPLHIIDTAGLRLSEDVVEQEGIRRAWKEIRAADRILLVTDAAAPRPWRESELWRQFQAELPNLNHLTLIRNKIDLVKESAGIEVDESSGLTTLRLSAREGSGIDSLREHLKQCAGYSATEEGGFIARRRHLDALQRASAFLDAAREQLQTHRAGELVAEDLREAQNALSEITGEFTSDDLLGRIFSSFCIGK